MAFFKDKMKERFYFGIFNFTNHDGTTSGFVFKIDKKRMDDIF